ncbi:MAG TPA: DUF1802 family protein [Thermoanaerobaculia bacterium]
MLPNHAALKEWAAVISALSSGDQILLLRKGGIADPRFGIEAERFYLYPTYLHQKEKQFKPEHRHHFTRTDRSDSEPARVCIELWGEATHVFRIDDLARLRKVDPFVIFTDETIEERFRFRPDQAVHVIAIRAYRLASPAMVESDPETAGCRSWISVAEDISIEESAAVLADAEFARRFADVERALTEDASRRATVSGSRGR